MKKVTLFIAIIALAAQSLGAQRIIEKSLPLSDISINRTDSRFTLNMNLLTDKFRPSKDREYVITPVLVSESGADSVEFAPVLVAGRNLWYRHIRENDLDGTPMYRSGKQATIPYSESVGLEDWMDNARLKIRSTKKGCCATVVAEYMDPIARVRRPSYTPMFNYVHPVADSVKEFNLSGSAFVNFPVNRTELYPDYMENPRELRRITGTIDSIRGDKDITITSIFIKGFASPEGPYNNNVRLAKGRTATLKQHVETICILPKDFIKTDFLPEDWPGLKAYLEKSAIANRDAILALVDSNMEPDAKDAKIKRDFPTEYAFLLANVYPWLRHSDYKITYHVRSYTSLEEILRVLATAPQKLSKEEFYRAAQSMRPGSDEYNEVFETAVRMYPDDEACNLNAANSAMQRGQYKVAERYLAKAGDGAEAIYARGILAALQKNYPEAEQFFERAARLKVADAPAALQAVRDMVKYADGRVEIIAD